ncbi:MAG: hypothetical protein ACREPD_09700 [Stenotrophomonas sp.]|uniref:hypothetical protein n=1 Tax=Stenotrophomonas sp. TaxID=69392 RepID=UPI003D6D7B45
MAQLRTQLDKQAARAGMQESATASIRGEADERASERQSSTPIELVRELRAAGITDERVLVTSLVEGMLLREFGARMSNDAEFHQTVARVVAAMADSPEAWALCRTCLVETQ